MASFQASTSYSAAELEPLLSGEPVTTGGGSPTVMLDLGPRPVIRD